MTFGVCRRRSILFHRSDSGVLGSSSPRAFSDGIVGQRANLLLSVVRVAKAKRRRGPRVRKSYLHLNSKTPRAGASFQLIELCWNRGWLPEGRLVTVCQRQVPRACPARCLRTCSCCMSAAGGFAHPRTTIFQTHHPPQEVFMGRTHVARGIGAYGRV